MSSRWIVGAGGSALLAVALTVAALVSGWHATDLWNSGQAEAQATHLTSAQADAAARGAVQAELDRIAESRGPNAQPYAEVSGRAIQASDFRLVSGGFGDGNVPAASIGVTSPAQPGGVWAFKFRRDPVEVPDPTVFGAKSGILEASVTLADSTGKVLGVTLYLHQ